MDPNNLTDLTDGLRLTQAALQLILSTAQAIGRVITCTKTKKCDERSKGRGRRATKRARPGRAGRAGHELHNGRRRRRPGRHRATN